MSYQKYIVWPYRPKLSKRFYIILSITITLSSIWHLLRGECSDDEVLQLLRSPNGRWTAIIDQRICDVGIGMSVVLSSLSVSAKEAPDQEINLMSVYPDYYDGTHPLLWSGPNTLQVALQRGATPKIINTRFGDGRLEVVISSKQDVQPAPDPNTQPLNK